MLDSEGMGDVKNKLLSKEALVALNQNNALSEGDKLIGSIPNAIKLVQQAKNSKTSVLSMINQLSMFDDVVYSDEEVAMALLLESDGFSKFLKQYNSEVGKETFFDGKMTKDKIIDNVLKQKIQNYDQVRKNIRSDAGQGKAGLQESDGGAERKSQPRQKSATTESTQITPETKAKFEQAQRLC